MLKTSYNCEVAEERSPAEYQVIANSPHIMDTRTKSISKGISTVSVSKRVEMTSKTRDIRRPIFSPTSHMITSESMRQVVPVVHVELSSGTKRTENSAQKNIPQGNNYHALQKRPSEPLSGGIDNSSQHQVHYNNILSIMKDQLNKSISSLQKKFEQELRKTQEGARLVEKKLKDTQEVLNSKIVEMNKLKDSLNSNIPRARKGQDALGGDQNAYLEYISGKVRDVDTKITFLIKDQTLQRSQQKRIESLTKNLQQKIEALGAQFIKMQLNKLNSLSTRVTKFVESRDKLLQNLITTTEQVTKKEKQPIEVISTNLQKYEDKLNELSANQENLFRAVQRFSTKEFKYDHFEVDNLKSELKRLNSLASKIENEHNQVKKTPFLSQPVMQKPITSLESFSQMAKKPEPQVRTYLMNSKLSFTGQTCSFEDYHPPNEGSQDERDHFFYPEQDTSYERFTDQEQSLFEQETSEAVVQLTDAIRKRKMKMPVKCSVNQGYVKLVDAGAYVLDMKGSLMEFSNQDLETAVGRKLISF